MLIHGRILILMSALNGVVREKPSCASEPEVLVICFNLNRLTFLHVRVKASLPWWSGGAFMCESIRLRDDLPNCTMLTLFVFVRTRALLSRIIPWRPFCRASMNQIVNRKKCVWIDVTPTSFSSQHYLFSIRNDNDYLRPGDWLYYVTGDIKSSKRITSYSEECFMYFFVIFKKTLLFFGKEFTLIFFSRTASTTTFKRIFSWSKIPFRCWWKKNAWYFGVKTFCAQSGVFTNDVLLQDFESLKRHESRRNCALQDSSRFSLRYLCVRKKKVQLPRCVLQHSIGLHESVWKKTPR